MIVGELDQDGGGDEDDAGAEKGADGGGESGFELRGVDKIGAKDCTFRGVGGGGGGGGGGVNKYGSL
jgi:hypothetical protein